MKKFETPNMVELNINETASGIFKSHVEVWPIHDKGTCHPVVPVDPVDPVDPVVPGDDGNKETVDKYSGQ